MAYPIQVFDPNTETGRLFLQNYEDTLTELFGDVQPNEKLHKYIKLDHLPLYLINIGIRTLKSITDNLPEGRWKGTIGVYGRKRGSVIKKEFDIMYRILINIGDTEIYYIEDFEPIVLPNGYGIILSPLFTENTDIKVDNRSIRSNIPPKLKEIIPAIRARNYMRKTVVLDIKTD